jgi:hypothetical protein
VRFDLVEKDRVKYAVLLGGDDQIDGRLGIYVLAVVSSSGAILAPRLSVLIQVFGFIS